MSARERGTDNHGACGWNKAPQRGIWCTVVSPDCRPIHAGRGLLLPYIIRCFSTVLRVLRALCACLLVSRGGRVAARGVSIARREQRRKVQVRRERYLVARIGGYTWREEDSATNDVVHSPCAERGENAPSFLRDGQQECRDMLRLAGKTLAQILALRGDASRARIEMTLAGHVAAERNQRCRPEAELVRAKQRRNDDIAARLQAAVRP